VLSTPDKATATAPVVSAFCLEQDLGSQLTPETRTHCGMFPETRTHYGTFTGKQRKVGGRTQVDPAELRALRPPPPSQPRREAPAAGDAASPRGSRSTQVVKGAAGAAKSLNTSPSTTRGSGGRTRALHNTGRDRPSAAEHGNQLAGFETERFSQALQLSGDPIGSAGPGRFSLAPASLPRWEELTLTPRRQAVQRGG